MWNESYNFVAYTKLGLHRSSSLFFSFNYTISHMSHTVPIGDKRNELLQVMGSNPTGGMDVCCAC